MARTPSSRISSDKAKQDQEEILQMIQDCENREGQMSEWEQSFIDSISTRLGNGYSLTDKQKETLERIWNKVTD
jgi:hypothetical protein